MSLAHKIIIAVLAIRASRHCFVYVEIDISLHSFFSSRLKSLFKPVAALVHICGIICTVFSVRIDVHSVHTISNEGIQLF